MAVVDGHADDEEENMLVEPEPCNQNQQSTKSRKRLREYDEVYATKESKRRRGLFLANRKPSYCLRLGIGSLRTGGRSLRKEHRNRLWKILHELFKRQNWVEASGVLNVLLLGTLRDQSISRNRTKYRAAFELLRHIKGGDEAFRLGSTDTDMNLIRSVFEIWIRKIGGLSNWLPQKRFAVQRELILFYLQCGRTEEAHASARVLRQQKGFDSNPTSNLFVGLVFYQRWYSSIPEELKLANYTTETLAQSEEPMHVNHMLSAIYEKNVALEAGAGTPLQSYSGTSIAKGKNLEDDTNKQREDLETDDKLSREASHSSFQPQERDMNSALGSEPTESYLPNYSGDQLHASIFYSQALPRGLLPLTLSKSHENLEDAVHKHRELQNPNYEKALKHLRVALDSTPPVVEALHPLIQLLLLGDEVDQAFDELKKFLSDSPDTTLRLRLDALLLENFDGGNYVRLHTCLENILKKDPKCGDTLAKLVLMHRRGDYETKNLVEMIALHLDATQGSCGTWKELASCFLKLSQCERDGMSTCCDGNDRHSLEYLDTVIKIPELFINGESGKTWRFRCRWWLTHHFNDRILMSDIASGNLERLTYKASVVSYLHGRKFRYALRATERLEKEDNMELYSFLQLHILNSVGFYRRKRST